MKNIFALSLIAFFAVSTATAFAQETTTTTASNANPVLTQAALRKSAILTQAVARKETAASNAAMRKEEHQATTLANLISRATKEIDRRITSLNALTARVNSLQKLSDAQKSTFTAKIQTEVTSLTDLKTKIQADTDLDTLRTDVKSIVASYRVYALFVPQIHILTASEGLLAATGKLNSAYGELNDRIDSAGVAGIDTAEMKTKLASMQAKITDANTQINNAITLVSALTPDGYPGNLSSLKTGRENLSAAKKDIMEAVTLAREILRMLRAQNAAAMPSGVMVNEETTQSSAPATTAVSPAPSVQPQN